MSREISDLTPQTALKAEELKRKCAARGVNILIYCTLRNLQEQAKAYRVGRRYVTIKNKCYTLRRRKLGFLADIIESVGPQPGRKKITNACCGESWHNYREAFDLVPLNDKMECVWDNDELWQIIFEEAEMIGLTVGGKWKKFQDKPHMQLRSGNNPLRIYSPDKIKEILHKNNLI